MEPRVLESLLRRWGRWKQDCVMAVGSTGTIEQKIKERLPFGDGCTGGGPPIEGLDGLQLLKPTEEVEKVNACYMQMLDSYKLEMWMLNYFYVFEWSFRHIAGATRSSKSTVKARLQRARNLIEARLSYESPSEVRKD